MTDRAIQTEASVPPRMLTDWMTRIEVSNELRISVQTLARWDRLRIGPPCVHLGRRVLYCIEGIRAWLASRENAPLRRGAR